MAHRKTATVSPGNVFVFSSLLSSALPFFYLFSGMTQQLHNMLAPEHHLGSFKRNRESWHFLRYVQSKKSVQLPQKIQTVLGAVHLHNKRQSLLLKEHSVQLGKSSKTVRKEVLCSLLFQLRNWDVQGLTHATGMPHNPWEHGPPSPRRWGIGPPVSWVSHTLQPTRVTFLEAAVPVLSTFCWDGRIPFLKQTDVRVLSHS